MSTSALIRAARSFASFTAGAGLPIAGPAVPACDVEKKMGKLTLTYATQIHACVVEIDQETGVTEIVD